MLSSFILYFPLRRSSSFILTGGDVFQEKKKRRRRGSIGPLQKSRFIASRENLKIFSYKFVYFEQETRKGKRHRDGSHVMATAFVQRKTHQVPQCVIATLFSGKAMLLCCFDATHPSID
jgi:hypothetical protein